VLALPISYSFLFNVSLFFFFSSRRRHTRFSRDWSSDVCSSDLREPALVARLDARDAQREALLAQQGVAAVAGAHAPDLARVRKIDRKSVGVGKECRPIGEP